MQSHQQYPPLSEADIPQLLQLLQSALSPDPDLQKQAEALLASLGTRVGYCSCLAAIVGNREADHSARWLAAVQLKNSVNKYWKSRYDKSGLSPEEKAYLRGKLLQLIPQDDNQIAVQVALVISKVARFDFPQQWPSLFHDLMAGITAAAAAAADGQQQQQPSVLLVRRTYFVLHHVLKELSSKRLAADQKAFAQVTALLFDHVWSSWRSLCCDLLSAVPAALASGQAAAPPALLLAFERWLLLLKIVRRLLLFGFTSDAKSLQPVAAVGAVAPELLQAAAALAAARHSSSSSSSSSSVGRSQLSVMVERGMLKIIKTLCQVQQEHPWSFHHAGVLLPTLDICYSQLLAAAGGGPYPAAREALLTSCCNTILGVMTCAGYQGKIGSGTGTTEDRSISIKQMSEGVSGQLASWWAAAAALPDIPALAAAAAAAAASEQQQQFSRAAVLLQTLVAGYFPLTHRDLEEWSCDGEQWAHSNSDIAGLTEGLRPCCHQLILTLMLHNKSELAPVLLNKLKTVSTVVPAGWVPQQQQQQLPGPVVTVPGGGNYPGVLLLKEAVYEAVGLVAYELHDYVDYQGWLRSSLLPEMIALQQQQQQQQQQQRLLPLLPRAAARLVGRWVADLKQEDRPAVYNALTLLLVQPQQQQQQQQHGPDVVLQLAAVSVLRTLVDDFGFESERFVLVLPTVVTALTGMLRQTDELDTQNQVFGLLNLIIDRLGPSDIHPHVGSILPLLPDIWAAAEDQSLLRIQVLCCLSLLVNVLGNDSHHTYSIILPLLRQALHPSSNQPELLEDALCLWLVALRNAHTGGSGQQQQQQVAAAAAAGVEGLLELTPALTACLTSSTEHIHIGMQILSSLLLLGGGQFLSSYGPQLLTACTAYVGNVVERGLLLMFPPMDLLLVAAPQQATTMMQPFMQRLFGLIMSGRESGVVVANSLALFGRLLLQNPVAFEQLLGSAAAVGSDGTTSSSGPEGLLVALVSLWCEAFDSIAQPLARKLAACALATVIGLPVKALLHHLPVLLSNIVSVWLEVEASGDDDPNTDRGEMFYGQGLWSGGSSSGGGGNGGFDDSCGFGDGGLLLGQSLSASEEAAGECARKQALRDAEPLKHIKISRLMCDKMAAAAAVHGQDFAAAMAALDPAIQQQVQTVIAAAAAHSGQQQQQQQRG